MAITNHERVGKAMELLKEGLSPFVERELTNVYKNRALAEAIRFVGDDRLLANQPLKDWDVSALLRLMWEAWNDVFRKTLGQAQPTLISELREELPPGYQSAGVRYIRIAAHPGGRHGSGRTARTGSARPAP